MIIDIENYGRDRINVSFQVTRTKRWYPLENPTFNDRVFYFMMYQVDEDQKGFHISDFDVKKWDWKKASSYYLDK